MKGAGLPGFRILHDKRLAERERESQKVRKRKKDKENKRERV